MLSWLQNIVVRLAFCCFAAASVAVVAVGDDWPTFRGPERSAVVNDTKLLKEWPKEGPKLLWEATGAGRGYASLAIVGDKLYTLGDGLSTKSDTDEYLSCFNRKTGKQLWATKTGSPWTSGKPDWQSSRSTPTVDGDQVYVVTPQGVLVCCETETGKELWKKDFKSAFKGEKADGWGYSESVLVDGEVVICTPGGGQATVVALNKKTGETVWTCVNPKDNGAGHSSIVISHVGGQKVYVQSTGAGLMGFADGGKLLWTYPISKTTAVIPTPIVQDDLVFYPVGYKTGGALVRQVPGSAGNVSVTELYGFNTKLANKHGGVVLVDNHLYGDSDDAGVPYCADLMTGEQLWASRGSGKGSAVVIAGGDRLYVRFQNGVLALVEVNPKEYKETGSFKIPGSGERPSWSHPVILDGRLYVREQDKILCYDIRG